MRIMIAFKCKMCGGDLEVLEGSTVCECEYCGSLQTTPVADSEKKTNLFNRANRFRRDSEFDRAAAIYASITAEFPREAEAYWGLCLCKYGIEYVDDPRSGNKIPTCHRTLTTSILDDSDYALAVRHADDKSRPVYESEAKKIDGLQQDILQIVRSEAPYDVFICYKETDENGNRTEDSVIAHEIYEKLTEKGLKVFFARVTLESKLGSEYEPYIYAALQSSRVMLVIGTSFERFDAVWVKNEWSRFLDMMKTDRSKKLIPCYKGIDVYDIPKEFQRLQAQDLSKLGWIQDLTRGVVKICEKQEVPTRQAAAAPEKPVRGIGYLDRAEVYLEDGLWDNADHYSDLSIRHEAPSSKAYLVKLMAELHFRNVAELRDGSVRIEEKENYKKAVELATPAELETLEGISRSITERIAESNRDRIAAALSAAKHADSLKEFDEIDQDLQKLQKTPEVSDCRKKVSEARAAFAENGYSKAVAKMRFGSHAEAQALFEKLGAYKDSKKLAEDCAREVKKEQTYREAFNLQTKGNYRAAADAFRSLGDYRDSARMAKKYEKKIVGYTGGKRFCAFLHMLLEWSLIAVVGYFSLSPVMGERDDTMTVIIAAVGFIATILLWKADKRKTTGRVFLDVLLCAGALVAASALTPKTSPGPEQTGLIIMGAAAFLTLIF